MRSTVLSAACLALIACGGIPCKNKAAAPTFTVDVKPIYDLHCVKCHSLTPTANAAERGDVPDEADYDIYSSAAEFATYAGQRVANKTMPPARENDPLSAADVETIQQWAACGTKQ